MNVISIMSPSTGESQVSAIEVTSEAAGEITEINGEPVLLGQEESEDFAQFLLDLAEQEPLPVETPDLPSAAPSVIEFETSQISKRIQDIIGINDNEATRELARAAEQVDGDIEVPTAGTTSEAGTSAAAATAQNVLLTVAYAHVPSSALSSNVEITDPSVTAAETADLNSSIAAKDTNTIQTQALQAQNAAPFLTTQARAQAANASLATDGAPTNGLNFPEQIPGVTYDLNQTALGIPARLENNVKNIGQHEQPIKHPLNTVTISAEDLDIDLRDTPDSIPDVAPIALRNSILFGDDSLEGAARPANQPQSLDVDPAAQFIDIEAADTVRAAMTGPAYHMDGEEKHIAPAPFSDAEPDVVKTIAPMPQISTGAFEIPAAQTAVHSAVHHSAPPPTHSLQITQAGYAELGNSLVQAAKTAKGVSVRLDPPELGRVFIDFQFDAHRNVTAIIRPEFADTSQLLQDQSAWLIQTLSNSGFDKVSLQFADAGQHNFGFEQGANHDQQQQGTLYQQDLELEIADAAPLQFIKSTSPLHYVRSDAPLNLKL